MEFCSKRWREPGSLQLKPDWSSGSFMFKRTLTRLWAGVLLKFLFGLDSVKKFEGGCHSPEKQPWRCVPQINQNECSSQSESRPHLETIREPCDCSIALRWFTAAMNTCGSYCIYTLHVAWRCSAKCCNCWQNHRDLTPSQQTRIRWGKIKWGRRTTAHIHTLPVPYRTCTGSRQNQWGTTYWRVRTFAEPRHLTTLQTFLQTKASRRDEGRDATGTQGRVIHDGGSPTPKWLALPLTRPHLAAADLWHVNKAKQGVRLLGQIGSNRLKGR